MNTNQSLGIDIIIRRCKSNNKRADIFVRITVNGQPKELSIKEQIDTVAWDNDKEMVKGRSIEVKSINEHIDNVRADIKQKYRALLDKGQLVTAAAVRDEYLGVQARLKGRTLKELLLYFTQIWKVKMKEGGFKNYKTTIKYITLFLDNKYGGDALFLSQVNAQFATDLEHYIRTSPVKSFDPCTGNGVGKHIQRFKRILNWASEDLKWIPVNQCGDYSCPLKKSKRKKLSLGELMILEDQIFIDSMLQYVADLFILSCYMGLAFADVMALKQSHFEWDNSGNIWCKLYRTKSDELCRIPLLKKAGQIIQKYLRFAGGRKEENIFPRVTNQNVNRSLKIIQEICGIQTLMTFHVARHTFAKTVALKNGVPLETVQMMMGHTKIATTQIYADVDEEKIFDDMSRIESVLERKREIIKSSQTINLFDRPTINT